MKSNPKPIDCKEMKRRSVFSKDNTRRPNLKLSIDTILNSCPEDLGKKSQKSSFHKKPKLAPDSKSLHKLAKKHKLSDTVNIDNPSFNYFSEGLELSVKDTNNGEDTPQL